MKIAVVTFPGSNCDYDLYKAIELAGGAPEFRWHRDTDVGQVDAVMLPGGFSFGDYLRCGAIAHMSPIMSSVVAFAERGGPVVGVCNGFQILCEAGLLPGALLRNDSMKFISQDVFIRVETTETQFTSSYEPRQILRVPVAHAEGNYHADAETISALEGDGRVIFRYVDRDGQTGTGGTPNGSTNDIAGIVNAGGNVLGMMPHPERAVEDVLGSVDGLALFTSLLSQTASAGV